MIVAVSITLSYYISYDIPELISGIEKWYKLFSDLSIGVIINFIFYVFQVYIPRREEEKATLRIIDPDLTKICQVIQEILLVAQTYLPGFEKGKIHFNKANLLAYSHGEYFGLNSKPLGSFGYSIKKKKKSR